MNPIIVMSVITDVTMPHHLVGPGCRNLHLFSSLQYPFSIQYLHGRRGLFWLKFGLSLKLPGRGGNPLIGGKFPGGCMWGGPLGPNPLPLLKSLWPILLFILFGGPLPPCRKPGGGCGGPWWLPPLGPPLQPMFMCWGGGGRFGWFIGGSSYSIGSSSSYKSSSGGVFWSINFEGNTFRLMNDTIWPTAAVHAK